MDKRKHHTKVFLSGVLSLVILCGSVSAVAYSAGTESTGAYKNSTEVEQTLKESRSKGSPKKLAKDETVYVIAGADGTAKKIIVSDWIKNDGGSDKIKDISNLDNIENVKGDETYTINENNMYEWNADGNDIYYQGTSKGELPVKLSITYTLDGKKVNPDSLAGKRGKLKLRFDYENRQYENVKLDGKDEKIYVPFVMLTGMIFDNDKFSDVEISNGKIINDGDRLIVAGFALPGMQENLDLDSDQLEIPDYVEVTADVKDFELSTTLTFAVNDVFADIDFSEADNKLDSLTKSLDEMADASDELIDGSSQLYDGLCTLLNKSGELIEGVNKLYDGAEKLNSGAKKLKNGTAELAEGAKTIDSGAGTVNCGVSALDSGLGTLSNGAQSLDDGVAQMSAYVSSLANGLDTISGNSQMLDSGAKQVFDTLLSTANAQIAAAGLSADKLTIENYSGVLDKLINSFSDENAAKLAYNTALETVTAAVNSQRDVIKSAVESAIRKQVTEGVLVAAGYPMTAEQYDSAVAAGQIPDEVQIQVGAAVAVQMSSESVQATIENNTQAQITQLIDSNMQSAEVQDQIAQGTAKAQTGRKSLESLKSQLDSYNAFYQGVLAYTQGVDIATQGARKILNGTYSLKDGSAHLKDGAVQLSGGAGQLKEGTAQLKNGSSSLSGGANKLESGAVELSTGMNVLFDGISILKDGGKVLTDGVKQLSDGSMTLCNGLKQFEKEGVDVLVNAVNGDIKGLVNRLKAISRVAGNYKSYSGISDDMDGKTSFIFKTNSIEK